MENRENLKGELEGGGGEKGIRKQREEQKTEF
jgi:hypothetical protein